MLQVLYAASTAAPIWQQLGCMAVVLESLQLGLITNVLK